MKSTSARLVENQSGRFGPSIIYFILHPSSFILLIALVALIIGLGSSAPAQTRQRGAHSTITKNAFTPADRRLVERAIGATCAERIRDPQGSMSIDEMQARPSLPISNPEAVAGARRADRLLPTTRTLVTRAIVQLAKDYQLYATALQRNRIRAATQRVEAVKRIKPDIDARDNASVVLREPRTIEFGTIFLAGLHSDEAMISVLAHELTHIASGQPDSLRILFRAIGRRAAARTGLRIQGQRAEELACDLVGVIAARQFINQTPSWEPLPRRLARAFEHNCVDDDASDEDHLSPRNTIRALLALDLTLAGEVTAGTTEAFLSNPRFEVVVPQFVTQTVSLR
jgi:Zn-dependent protease with chaperone function